MKLTGKHKINFRNNLDENFKDHQKQLIEDHNFAKYGEIDFSASDIPPFPVEGDFVNFPFRHLSATIVGAGSWKATDFSNESVLRKSLKLLEGKPVYKNHRMVVDNEVGFVGKLKWTPSYTNKAGIKIPGGIDGPVTIDSKLYPDLVRKMSGPHPYVKSASVSVIFEWESSHDFENSWEFWENLGKELDGEMVRRVVTKITDYYETSLVWLGADPYAGILDDEGQVVFVDRSGAVELSAPEKIKEAYEKNSLFHIDFWLGKNNSLCLSKSNDDNKQDKMEELLKKIALKFNCNVSDITSEMIDSFVYTPKDDFQSLETNAGKVSGLEQKVNQLETDNKQIDQLKSDKTELEGSVSSLQSEVDSLKPMAEKATELLGSRKNYAVEMYTKSVCGDTDNNIVNELNSETSFEIIESKIKMFGGKALNSFGASCKKCGSKDVSFRSSKEDGDGGVDDGFKEADSLSLNDMLKMSKNK